MVIAVLRTFLSPIKGRFIFAIKQVRWRRNNAHNSTTISEDCQAEAVKVGKETYGQLNVHWFGNPNEKLVIGNCCSIALNVHFLLGGEHDYRRASNFPFGELYYGKESEVVTKGPIIVEDDVWIGFGSIILSGVTLGRGCVIGAGSVVAKDIPAYAVYVNGRIMKYRFDDEIIEKLKCIDYGIELDKQYSDYCQTRVTHDNVDAIINAIRKD